MIKYKVAKSIIEKSSLQIFNEKISILNSFLLEDFFFRRKKKRRWNNSAKTHILALQHSKKTAKMDPYFKFSPSTMGCF